MATSFENSWAHTATLHSAFPALQQATTDPCLHWRLLDTHRQVWVSLLWGHCSFLLCPGVYKLLSVPSRSLFPQPCVSSVIKSDQPPKSNSLRVLSPFSRPPGWEIYCGSQNFFNSARIFWCDCSAVCGSSAWQLFGGIVVTFSKMACATGCVTRLAAHGAPDPAADHCSPAPLQEMQTQVWLFLCGVLGSWCTQGFV